jgi:hypothetical protein
VTVRDVIAKRQIEEVLHFTTNNGLLGMLRQGVCKSRALLKQDETLVFILKLNTQKEFDTSWKNYVNLSLSRINTTLFEYSRRVNANFAWRILSFSSEILTHDGVLFTTTNNAYWQHLQRAEGADGLEALFQPTVAGRYGFPGKRNSTMPDNFTTDIQAEVLYPQELPLTFLRRIYVPTHEDADSVYGKFNALSLPEIEVVVAPDKFTGA